ncbi:MAG: 6-phosphofructokinase [Clostridia bacterium]
MANRVNENSKKLAVLTSGGDASGMNACIRAVVRYALNQGFEVYGVRRGYLGLVEDDIFQMEYKSVSNCVHSGGTILRTGRSKDFKEKEVMLEAVGNLTKRGVNNLIVIGGDGSFRGIQDLHQFSDLNVIGIPATIDNDMGFTDYTIGFDTACNTVLDAILKLRDTITSHDRIMVLEVMGRACGDIALYTAVAGGAEYVILPEAPVDVDVIAQGVKEGFDRGKTSTIIVLAEGRNDIKEQLIKKVGEATGRTVNHVALSYMQRGGIPSMSDRVLASRMAIRAVDLLKCHQSGRCVGVRGGDIMDMSVFEALNAPKVFDEQLYNIAKILSK